MYKNMMDRIDPELSEPLKKFLNSERGRLDSHDINARRALQAKMLIDMKEQTPVIQGITCEDRLLPGPNHDHDVAVRVYRPTDHPTTLPALLWIHGGGYIFGNPEQDDFKVKNLTATGRCITVSVDYRLAPENPFPAGLEDCYLALKWIFSNADTLGIDRTHIAIGGGSAGGGLAASLALLARDRREVSISFQMLLCPMIDDRNILPASDSLPDTLVWTRESNRIGWQSYLGRSIGAEDLPPYAAAYRAINPRGLPPAYIAIGELDLFLNESTIYAQRLIQAEVPTELHVYRGAFHGFEMTAPEANISRRFVDDYCQALKRALRGRLLSGIKTGTPWQAPLM
jgi:acetyl esterase/lipase